MADHQQNEYVLPFINGQNKENDTMPFWRNWMFIRKDTNGCVIPLPQRFQTTGSHNPRVMIGNKDCTQPYSCSIYNISAMSYGALSSNVVEAMNAGDKIGGFTYNTGEGGFKSIPLKT